MHRRTMGRPVTWHLSQKATTVDAAFLGRRLGTAQTHPVGLGNPATLQAPLAGPLGNKS